MKKLNVIVFFLLAVAVSAFAAEAKSPAVLLQQGIYAEETEGNLDKAMGIYSQIRSDYNDVERITAIATYQLGLCNLKKDNKQKAIELFQEVVNYYPEQTVAAKKAQQQLDKILPPKTKTSLQPVVIKTSPENFANNISPDVNQITITFDKTMSTNGYSWCQNDSQTFPETTGKPFFGNDKLSCTLPVKLKAGQYYRISINTPPYFGFKDSNGDIAGEYIIVFATADANGNLTAIPEDLIIEAKKINSNPNSTPSEPPYTQEIHYDIEPNGLMNFSMPMHLKNNGNEPLSTYQFINSDFVNLTKMTDINDKPIEFNTTHEGTHFRYFITFSPPIKSGQDFVYNSYGTMTGLISPIPDMKDTYQYYMKHHPSSGQPTLRIETYLLPKGAEVISTVPPNMKRTEKNGRIELGVEKVIPAGGSITTAFQYKLKTSE